MSLVYGCIYIIRFRTMRKTYKAAEWAHECENIRTGIFWNIWVLLAMLATWLAWSLVLFIACLMSFIWRTGTTDDVNRAPTTPGQALAPRIILSIVLTIGIVYFFLVVMSLTRYGPCLGAAYSRPTQSPKYLSVISHLPLKP
ncbi:hypothetical protein BDZ97DRAFT_1649932 [Flammula alnicola]|nr:hypothetical protein BDZ97DRAFT_1649932 [Flammula alnicola]